jgi:hypothetical protein
MKKPTILLVGLGDLGSVVLEFLAREEQIGRIVVVSRNETRGIARCNLARLGAVAQGYSPSIEFTPLDITDKKSVIEVVRRELPDIILTTATMQTWWLPDLLPPERAARVRGAGFGMWLPVHLTLTLKLMEALRDLPYEGITLTAPFPDVVNCILGCLQLAPTCGVGNLDEIVPKVRILAAERLEVSVKEVNVLLVAHHAFESVAFGEPFKQIPPYFVRIEHDGQDVTEHVRAEELLLGSYPIPPGPVSHFLTAGCTLRLIRAFLSKRDVLTHVPGPEGLPGGYPVTVSREGLKLVPVKGLTREEAITINERSHRFDGIERIEADGTVVFCPESVEALRAELGYECERLAPEEAEERANELVSRFREYTRRHGVHLEPTGGVRYVLRNQ